MFYWIYDIPALLVIALFEAVFVAVCWLGTLLVRPFARSWLHEEPRLNDMLAAFLQYFGVIYGLLLGLLAVATYQDRSDVEKGIASEASSLAALYRNITAYPEPSRTELQDLMREHTRYIIEDAWPLQRRGIVPVDEVNRIAALQARLALFEPQTKAQELVHENTLRQFNTFYEHRRARLYSLTSGITAEMGEPAGRDHELRPVVDRPRGARRIGRGAHGHLRHPRLGDRLCGRRTQQTLGQVCRRQEHDGVTDLFRPLHAARGLAPLCLHPDRDRPRPEGIAAGDDSRRAVHRAHRAHQGRGGSDWPLQASLVRARRVSSIGVGKRWDRPVRIWAGSET
jgi:hypothetical protein